MLYMVTGAIECYGKDELPRYFVRMARSAQQARNIMSGVASGVNGQVTGQTRDRGVGLGRDLC